MNYSFTTNVRDFILFGILVAVAITKQIILCRLVEGVLNYLIKLHISNPSINPPIAPTTRNQLSLTKYVIFLFKLFIFIYLLYLYIYSPLNSDKIDGLFVSYSSFYISPTIADNNFILRVIFNQMLGIYFL